MIAEKNSIKKLTVEVDTNSMAIALQLKDNLDGFIKEKIVPILEHILKEKTKEENTLILEKLKLDIDINHNEKLDEIVPKIKNKIEKEIEKIIKDYTKKNRLKSNTKSTGEAFIHFLRNGQYPWWFSEKKDITINGIKTLEKETLKSLFLESNTLNRLLYQFDIKIINEIYLYTFENYKKHLNYLGKIPSLLQNEEFKTAFLKLVFQRKLTSHPTQFSTLFYNQTLHYFSNTISSKKYIEIAKNDLKKIIELVQFSNKYFLVPIQISKQNSSENTFFFTISNSLNEAAILNQNLLQKIDSIKSIKLVQNTTEKDSKSIQNLVSKKVPKNQEKELQNLESFEEIKEQKIEILDENLTSNEYLINNAGLILIHPFIKHFFEKLELLSNDKIKDQKIDEAIHLLHYLATKQEQPSEQLLTFEKYLCNIPFNRPIKRYLKLSEDQKNACEELLKAMLGHWKGLKTENTDILRNEFLSREGKLTVTEERELLYIQRKTQDILLDSIPWNFHVVKIPWKNNIVFVEW